MSDTFWCDLLVTTIGTALGAGGSLLLARAADRKAAGEERRKVREHRERLNANVRLAMVASCNAALGKIWGGLTLFYTETQIPAMTIDAGALGPRLELADALIGREGVFQENVRAWSLIDAANTRLASSLSAQREIQLKTLHPDNPLLAASEYSQHVAVSCDCLLETEAALLTVLRSLDTAAFDRAVAERNATVPPEPELFIGLRNGSHLISPHPL